MNLHGIVDFSEGVMLRVPGSHELGFHGCELVFESERCVPHLAAERHFDGEDSVVC